MIRLALFALLCLATQAQAFTLSNLYVSAKNGDDGSGDGTSGNPYKTIQHVLDTHNADEVLIQLFLSDESPFYRTSGLTFYTGTMHANAREACVLRPWDESSDGVTGTNTYLWVGGEKVPAFEIDYQGNAVSWCNVHVSHLTIYRGYIHGGGNAVAWDRGTYSQAFQTCFADWGGTVGIDDLAYGRFIGCSFVDIGSTKCVESTTADLFVDCLFKDSSSTVLMHMRGDAQNFIRCAFIQDGTGHGIQHDTRKNPWFDSCYFYDTTLTSSSWAFDIDTHGVFITRSLIHNWDYITDSSSAGPILFYLDNIELGNNNDGASVMVYEDGTQTETDIDNLFTDVDNADYSVVTSSKAWDARGFGTAARTHSATNTASAPQFNVGPWQTQPSGGAATPFRVY